jgi:hypothetical protein
MKKILIILICILLLNVLFDFSLINKQKKQLIQLDDLYNANAKLNHNVEALKASMIDSWHAERAAFNIDNIFTEEGEKLNPEYLKALYPVLIFRFSKIDCSECVVKQISVNPDTKEIHIQQGNFAVSEAANRFDISINELNIEYLYSDWAGWWTHERMYNRSLVK